MDCSSLTKQNTAIPEEQKNQRASQVALVVKNSPANAGDVRDAQALGGEDPMEKEMATHSSILGWRIPWRQEPDGLWSIGSQRVGHS